MDQVERKSNKKGNSSKVTSSGKANKASDDHKSTSKLLEKTASVDGTSTKSSSESLNFIPNIDPGINPTKARSATLPLTSKVVASGGQPENVSISQSDMSGQHFDMLNGRAGYNVVVTKNNRQQQQQQQQLQLQPSSSKQPAALAKTQFDFVGNKNVLPKFPDVSSTAFNSQREPSASQLYFDMTQQPNNRDIWDSPITSFDSGMVFVLYLVSNRANTLMPLH